MTTTTSDLHYILAEALVLELQQHDGAERKAVVVDVREPADFAAEHIRDAENAPSGNWSNQEFVNSFIDRFLSADTNNDRIVMHCVRCRNRGPNCALVLHNRIKDLASERNIDINMFPVV